jgi:hypothetical protein
MQYSPYHPLRKYTSPLFDPLTTTATALQTIGGGSALNGGAMALSGIGTGISAANTLAGGRYAAQVGQMKRAEANYQADQSVENAAGEIAAAQRQAIGTSQKANLLRSSAVADAAANGVNPAAGSALTNQAAIVNKGQQNAWLDLWSGQNRASGLMNQAQGLRYSGDIDALAGQEAQRASYLNAASTIAGGGASLLRMYGGGRGSSGGSLATPLLS